MLIRCHLALQFATIETEGIVKKLRISGREMKKACNAIGDIIIISWSIVLGPIGILLTLLMIYALQAGNATLTVICAGFLFTPILSTIIFGLIKVPTILRCPGIKIRKPGTPLTVMM
jgi:hypothetical protein